jgi:hypothetical protein
MEYNNIFGYGIAYQRNGYIPKSNNYQNQSQEKKDESRTDGAFLDNVLGQFDQDKRNEVIGYMIKERINLKDRFREEVENEKSNLRSIKYLSVYQMNPNLSFKDWSKLYTSLNQLKEEEEINAWKDISLLKLKLWEEGWMGGYKHENSQV